MAATHTVKNEEIRNTVTETGVAIEVGGAYFAIGVKLDLDKDVTIVIQGSNDDDFGDLWTIDTFVVPAQVVATPASFRRDYGPGWEYIRATATAAASPTGGEIDVFVFENDLG